MVLLAAIIVMILPERVDPPDFLLSCLLILTVLPCPAQVSVEPAAELGARRLLDAAGGGAAGWLLENNDRWHSSAELVGVRAAFGS